MRFSSLTILAGAALASTCLAAVPSGAMTIKECSAKYQAAKDAGTLGPMKWNDFRKAQCADNAATDNTATAKTKKATAATEDSSKGLTTKECSDKYQAAKNAGTLGGMKWNDFRKAQCGPGASAAAEQPKITKTATQSGGGLPIKECSARYQSAKEAGTLGGLNWNAFRKAKCGAGAAEDETVPAENEAQYTNEPEKPAITAPRGVQFPNAIASKFSSESAGKARMHTCLEQYYADKDSNDLGGLKWIQKGGGFYSLCNARLKGQTG